MIDRILVIGSTVQEVVNLTGDSYLARNNALPFLGTGWGCDICCVAHSPQDYIIPFNNPNSIVKVVSYSNRWVEAAAFAIAQGYRIVVATGVGSHVNLKSFHDQAVAAGIVWVVPLGSNQSLDVTDPPYMWSAIAVGGGDNVTNLTERGPACEVRDDTSLSGANQQGTIGSIAGKLSRIFYENPTYNLWDARQHLRQLGSHYSSGWSREHGYGKVANTYSDLVLNVAPPIEVRYSMEPQSGVVTFNWRKFMQTGLTATVIKRQNGTTLYEGSASTYEWEPDTNGVETFYLYHKVGATLSRLEANATLRITGLRNQTAEDSAYITGRILAPDGSPQAGMAVVFLPVTSTPEASIFTSAKPTTVLTNAQGYLQNNSLTDKAFIRAGSYKIQIAKRDVFRVNIPSDGGVHTLTSLITT